MSLSNILHPNTIDLYCNNLTSNDVTAVTNNVSSITVYDSSGTSLGISLTPSYNINGFVNIFYTTVTSTTGTVTAKPYIQLGRGGNFNLTGFPEMAGSNGRAYNTIVYNIGSGGGTELPLRLEIKKVSSTTISIRFYPYDGAANLPTDTYSFGPFIASYPAA